jgi:hypothetical protein
MKIEQEAPETSSGISDSASVSIPNAMPGKKRQEKSLTQYGMRWLLNQQFIRPVPAAEGFWSLTANILNRAQISTLP